MTAATETGPGRLPGDLSIVKGLFIGHVVQEALGLQSGCSTGRSRVFGHTMVAVEASRGYVHLRVTRESRGARRVFTDIEAGASDPEAGISLDTCLNAQWDTMRGAEPLSHREYHADRPGGDLRPLVVIAGTIHAVRRLQQSNLTEIGSA